MEDVRSLAELPAAFFVEVIDPEVHRLVEGAPGERRRWLDWGVFHVEPSFLDHWVRFSRALRQRNAALKQGEDPKVWDGEITLYGELVARQRSALVRDHQAASQRDHSSAGRPGCGAQLLPGMGCRSVVGRGSG